MLATLVRGTVLLFLAVMIATWALSVASGGKAEPQGEPAPFYLYC
jgi:hypothetical protein